MKISFITTIYNEENTIEKFLDSLFTQTKLPDEVIIVDGGSTDATIERIKIYDLRFKEKKINFKFLAKKGNRSVGRNEAIRNATGDIIVCSDAGNILDKNWIKNITKLFLDSRFRGNDKVDVVAGYYKGQAKTVFQKCLIPYVLVMPDKVNPKTFLPATRSIAFTKSIWKKVGGFDEKLSHNEDYAFARKLKTANAKIEFAKDAIVNWIPRDSFRQVFVMFFRFAFGDAEAGILRPKVAMIFTRYILGLILLSVALFLKSDLLLATCYILLATYFVWSIKKNYKYVRQLQALYLLPVLQINADLAVISGSSFGYFKKILSIMNK